MITRIDPMTRYAMSLAETIRAARDLLTDPAYADLLPALERLTKVLPGGTTVDVPRPRRDVLDPG